MDEDSVEELTSRNRDEYRLLGHSLHEDSPLTMSRNRIIKNKWEKNCDACGVPVPVGAGCVISKGGKWLTYHFKTDPACRAFHEPKVKVPTPTRFPSFPVALPETNLVGPTSSTTVRNAVWAMAAANGYRCFNPDCGVVLTPYSDGSPNAMHVDHVIPSSLGGPDELANYQPLCRSCNTSKGDRSSADYRPAELRDHWIENAEWMRKAEEQRVAEEAKQIESARQFAAAQADKRTQSLAKREAQIAHEAEARDRRACIDHILDLLDALMRKEFEEACRSKGATSAFARKRIAKKMPFLVHLGKSGKVSGTYDGRRQFFNNSRLDTSLAELKKIAAELESAVGDAPVPGCYNRHLRGR